MKEPARLYDRVLDVSRAVKSHSRAIQAVKNPLGTEPYQFVCLSLVREPNGLHCHED